MAPDSLTLCSAALLLCVALYAAVAGAGRYLRVAAALLGALALALLGGPASLAPAVSLPVLPLAGMCLGLSGLARCGRRLSALPASLLLVASLGAGVMALFAFHPALVLLPLLAGAIAAFLAAASRGAVMLAMAGLLLGASAPALLARGLTGPGLLLLAAALAGFALQNLASSRRAGLAAAA